MTMEKEKSNDNVSNQPTLPTTVPTAVTPIQSMHQTTISKKGTDSSDDAYVPPHFGASEEDEKKWKLAENDFEHLRV